MYRQVFYYATFPTIVKSLPDVIQSEKDAFEGRKDPAEHAHYLSLSRAKVSDTALLSNKGDPAYTHLSSTTTAL